VEAHEAGQPRVVGALLTDARFPPPQDQVDERVHPFMSRLRWGGCQSACKRSADGKDGVAIVASGDPEHRHFHVHAELAGIYLCADVQFISASAQKPITLGVATDLVRDDIYYWLMAGALIAIDRVVAGITGGRQVTR
jgi:hypothetical protein